MNLVFATNNQNKIKEIEMLLNNNINIISLKEIGFSDEIPEDKNTIKENASQKANFIFNINKVNCFADDTGLEIEVLNAEPGVMSARYAGESKDSERNIQKVLDKMNGSQNRNALFRTVISLILDEEEYFFEGIVNGHIINEKRGNLGFGYDPVFIPDGFKKTFAEMSLVEKNKISHRAIAFNKLIEFLNNKIVNI